MLRTKNGGRRPPATGDHIIRPVFDGRIKTGSLRIELQFAQALRSVINVIVFAEFDNQIEINSLREIITDY